MSDKTFLIVPFLFGAVVGSFLNVCIHRLPIGISIVTPPSRCPRCARHIPFYYNIPIISYFVLLGRCRYCRAPLSFQYPFVEALTGVAALFLFERFGLGAELFIYFGFICALIVVTFIDLEHQIIPDSISLPGIVIGFAASFFLPSPGVRNSLIGIVLGGGLLLAIAYGYYFATGKEGMGGGDIKLLAMIGAFLGWRGVLVTVLAGSFSGAFIGAVVMVFSRRGSKFPIPFGPFLAAGAALYLFYGEGLIRWYLAKAAGGFF